MSNMNETNTATITAVQPTSPPERLAHSSFDLAAQKLAARDKFKGPEPVRLKSVLEILELPEAKRPVVRFLADRRARPHSMAGYKRRLRLMHEPPRVS